MGRQKKDNSCLASMFKLPFYLAFLGILIGVGGVLASALLLAGAAYFIFLFICWIFRLRSPLGNINFDSMSGTEFENFCAKVLRYNGFKNVIVTKGSGDHGIDVLANKNGKKYAIQCKCYSNNVGNKAVQEAYSGKAIYGADIAVVMTNRYFTKQAELDARKLNVQLWGRNKLQNLINFSKENKINDNTNNIPAKHEDKLVEKEFESHQASKENVVEMVENTKITKPEQNTENEKTVKIKDETAGNFEVKKQIPVKYIFPPLSILIKGVTPDEGYIKVLRETAIRLKQTLSIYGIKVAIIDASIGPRFTRYELQPEQGVRIGDIVGLKEDIKLNLAATDIRIEAPISGKAAIGIEVLNKKNMTVTLRDLLESKEFKGFSSDIAFAVGKDIVGKVVIADIAKMPNMLIAGMTGSGKSAFINTIIMSILYKAHPYDVKMIMIDTKMVNLSIYNGIPHLLIPVVTDLRKALKALHWAKSEIEHRYKEFSKHGFRNLKEYNNHNTTKIKFPQIVIIIDDLYDLVTLHGKEAEQQIAEITRLSRSAGVYLIISTQRPSADVVTGLIKTNISSRVAFKVFSTIDSRVILEEKGAEELLGDGDMLLKLIGHSKPVRVQGAYVSDKEILDAVDFLKNQEFCNAYSENIEEKIKNAGTLTGFSLEYDQYFVEAGRFAIEKDKISIGMIQRVFKIGFNRAVRIMDQLCEAGVVGEEEGTKPRKILMTLEEFEGYIEKNL